MNHLEQLVSEWLQYRGYFVRTSVLVGPRSRGGFEGELDVVGLHVNNKHLIHIECSLDALPWPVREQRFAKKFEQGRRHVRAIFAGIALPETLDQVVLLQFAGRNAPDKLGGGRLVTGKQFVREVFDGLEGTRPASGAVPSTFPLLRTLQLAAAAQETSCDPLRRVIPAPAYAIGKVVSGEDDDALGSWRASGSADDRSDITPQPRHIGSDKQM